MSLQVWRMLQKPLCGNQMNLATLTTKKTYQLRVSCFGKSGAAQTETCESDVTIYTQPFDVGSIALNKLWGFPITAVRKVRYGLAKSRSVMRKK